MSAELVERLHAGEVLIADGATGTALMDVGLPPGTPPELWNVEQPERILGVHQAYREAGSQILLTITLGGSRIKLKKAGLEGRVAELNRAAVVLVRKAADGQAYVAGDIGPTGEMMAPLGSLTMKEAIETFAEQAAALAEGGADLIWIETMIDLGEARAAVLGAREATSLPIFCSMSFDPRARTLMGQDAAQVAAELWPLGLSAIGANCGEGPDAVDDVLMMMKEVAPTAPLIAKPNAGRPQLVDGQTVWDTGPDELAVRMADFVGLGAQVVGACCGSTPAHIAALTNVVHQLQDTGTANKGHRRPV